jgi:zinc transport system substrate-binding protein
MAIVVIRLAAIALLLRAQGACAATETAEPFRILASFHPVLITTLNVARGVPGVEVASLTPPDTGCMHDRQLAPADLVALGRASVLIVNGAGIESFLAGATNRVVSRAVIDASAGVALITNAGSVNPHVWLSVTNVMLQTDAIARGLARLDPAHAAQYEANAARYRGELATLQAHVAACASRLKARPVVTQHDAFPYLARDLGLTIAGVIQTEPGMDVSAGQITSLVRSMRTKGVSVVFAEPQYSCRTAALVAREAGATVHMLDSCVTGPATTNSYLAAMEANVAVVERALGGGTP